MSYLRKNQELIDNSSLEKDDDTFFAKFIGREADPLENRKKSDIDNDIISLYTKERNFNEYFLLIQDIHNVLLHCKDLTYQEKFELCTRERSHMKGYLREVLKRIFK